MSLWVSEVLTFEQQLLNFQNRFESQSRLYFESNFGPAKANSKLFDSMSYSFFSEGKRFRPYLSYLTARTLGLSFDDIFPIALSVELVHTYSLIHDDLPCMDNDDLRRGKPTNHKVFGESLALLAGDALLTESFGVLSHLNFETHKSSPSVLKELISILTTSIGARGMVLGQVLDMDANASLTEDQLLKIHQLKTGNLITAAIELVSCYKNLNPEFRSKIHQLGHAIGLSFQVKDDLLDANDKDQDFKSFIRFHGVTGTEKFLESISARSVKLIEELNRMAEKNFSFSEFNHVIEFNQKRTK